MSRQHAFPTNPRRNSEKKGHYSGGFCSSDNNPTDSNTCRFRSSQLSELVIASIEVVLAKLNDRAKRHVGVLEHVVKGQVLDGVVSGVYLWVRILKGGLENKGRGISSLGRGSVIRAGVAALGLDPGDFAVL